MWPQCTGGNYTDWRDVQDFAHIGFPVVEAYEDGLIVVTKRDGTGGLINVESVTSQLLYELAIRRVTSVPIALQILLQSIWHKMGLTEKVHGVRAFHQQTVSRSPCPSQTAIKSHHTLH